MLVCNINKTDYDITYIKGQSISVQTGLTFNSKYNPPAHVRTNCYRSDIVLNLFATGNSSGYTGGIEVRADNGNNTFSFGGEFSLVFRWFI